MRHARRHQRRTFLGVAWAAVLSMFAKRAPAQAVEGLRPHRRVVTGVNAAGKSFVASDGPVPPEGAWAVEGGDVLDLWFVDRVPVDLSDARDPIKLHGKHEWPPPAGAIARIVTWRPGHTIALHRSATLDFVFIIAGQLELLLDDASVTLGSGDSVVQRGTTHGWRVVGDQPCTLAAVLLGTAS